MKAHTPKLKVTYTKKARLDGTFESSDEEPPEPVPGVVFDEAPHTQLVPFETVVANQVEQVDPPAAFTEVKQEVIQPNQPAWQVSQVIPDGFGEEEGDGDDEGFDEDAEQQASKTSSMCAS